MVDVVGADSMTIAFRLDADAKGASGELFRMHGSFITSVTSSGELQVRMFKEGGSITTLTTKGSALNAAVDRDRDIVIDLDGGKLQVWVDGKMTGQAAFAGVVGGETFGSHDLVFGNPWNSANFKGDISVFDLSVGDSDTAQSATTTLATASTAQEHDFDYAVDARADEDARFDFVTQYQGLDVAA
ncbi:LamG domain-containing protein [Rubellimicrobium roseum]|uniref:LamG domain-containing protein n=1 Tax=Rubellimicrobium roseum TaxID=687525 RepID=A0A5C4NLX5_9RHOB|nr:LamG domain-containing protein [Rubellimicrobium roseum]